MNESEASLMVIKSPLAPLFQRGGHMAKNRLPRFAGNDLVKYYAPSFRL